MRQTTERYERRLENLFNKIQGLVDLELQAQFARYLCVLLSGFIEVAIRDLLGGYARARANQNISGYVNHKLSRETNLNMSKIVELFNKFNQTWGEELETQTKGELKDAIDSIVANRHKIAHGEDTGVGFLQVKEWYKKTKNVVNIMDQIIRNS